MAAFTTVPTTHGVAGCAAVVAMQQRSLKRSPAAIGAKRQLSSSCRAQMSSQIKTAESSQIKTAESLQGENLTCMRQDDGSLLVERLPPGRYSVSPAPPSSTSKAFCSVSNGQSKCVTYCTLDDDFQLRCEGLEEGVYTVNPASEADVDKMVTHIWSTLSYQEDDEPPMDGGSE